MSAILGTTRPTAPSGVSNNTNTGRPRPIDSRTKPGTVAQASLRGAPAPTGNVAQSLPSDVNALQQLQRNVEARLLAAEVHATGAAGPGVGIDDLVKLPTQRLRELKARAASASEFAGCRINSRFEWAKPALADAFIGHRLQHEAAAEK